MAKRKSTSILNELSELPWFATAGLGFILGVGAVYLARRRPGFSAASREEAPNVVADVSRTEDAEFLDQPGWASRIEPSIPSSRL